LQPGFERINPPFILKLAQMAESVDALVSNTCGRKAVPVRPRLWVPKKASDFLKLFYFSDMASVYILYSEKFNRFYIGSCKDLSYRVDRGISSFLEARICAGRYFANSSAAALPAPLEVPVITMDRL
jgi:hypothetical protein